jgi:hypothetical protein
MAKTKRSENNILYPIEYNGRFYYREDCDELFVQFYTNEDILSADCSICVFNYYPLSDHWLTNISYLL